MATAKNIQTDNIYQVPVTDMQGKTVTLEPYRGKTCLLVNVASRCGLTPQYKALESLYQHNMGRDFVVLGFPCDQFLHQEPGCNEEIKAFAETRYRVTFPLFAKIEVRGPNQAPIYKYIAGNMQKRSLLPLIPWNFTKILIDKQGRIHKRYLPTTSCKVIQQDLDQLLNR